MTVCDVKEKESNAQKKLKEAVSFPWVKLGQWPLLTPEWGVVVESGSISVNDRRGG